MTLRDRLYRYLLKNHGYVSKGALEKLVMQHTTYTADNTGRRLRELAEEGLLEVDIRDGHAWYKAKPPKSTEELRLEGLRMFENL
jgi:hypothetical protein